MAAAQAAPRIFVSYARGDGRETAAKLRRRLQDEHGFPLWQDLADMEGGRDWWPQITGAIDRIEFLVLVMTPAALSSEYARRVWRYARQQGRCVIPVIGASGIDFDALPGWMRRTHFVDPAEPDQWRRFVRTLEAPCRATRAPFMVEDLPQVFVQRPRELEQLVASLLESSGAEPVVLRGAAGYGKTTLARALCHDERVQDAFDDGILWVTLGEQPGDIQSRVVDLIEVLTGERPGFRTTEAAVTRLGEVMSDRRMLIVLDDVWQAAHARPFLHAGRNCARLITTRNRDVLPPNAKPIDVDAMTAAEAIRLLRFGLPDGEDAAFARLAQRLGEWALLLKLVNGALHKRLAAGQPLAAALAWVNAGLDRRGLTVFDARDPVERGDAVARTLGVSLELLTEHERGRFSELAIFPGDVDVPLAAVETLWSRTAELGVFETEELCDRFFNYSLLKSLDRPTRRFRMHSAVRRFLQDSFAGHLSEIHSQLLEAYRSQCSDGWHTGPNDGYFYQHLPYHLAAAGRNLELKSLLFDYRWMYAKLRITNIDELITDYLPLQGDTDAQALLEALSTSRTTLLTSKDDLARHLSATLRAHASPVIVRLLSDIASVSSEVASFLPFAGKDLPLGMIFRRHGIPEVTFVETKEFARLAAALQEPGRGIIIQGPSGIGKTSLLEIALRRLQIRAPSFHVEKLTARNPSDVERVQSIRTWHRGLATIDDFHRLAPELLLDLADHMKDLADHEIGTRKLVLVGIPGAGRHLVKFPKDVLNRIEFISVDRATDDHVRELIQKGEEYLNICFSHREAIVARAKGTLSIAQQICYELALRAGISEPQEDILTIEADPDTAISQILSQLGVNFEEIVVHFVELGSPSDHTSAFVLKRLAESNDGIVSLLSLAEEYSNRSGGLVNFKRNLSEYLSEHPSDKDFVLFDDRSGVLVADDPQFRFYLGHADWKRIMARSGKLSQDDVDSVFISYSHSDGKWLEILKPFLRPLEREYRICFWADTKIAPGKIWRDEIQLALRKARVAILLITPNFIGSDFIANNELPPLLSKAKQRGVVVLPVVLSSSPIEFAPGLEQFQMVNDPRRPLDMMTEGERNQILTELTREVWRVVGGGR